MPAYILLQIRPRYDCVLCLRQIDFKGGAFIRFAVNPDIPTALFHNSVHGRETEACAFAYFFGGEKRFKDARLRIVIHSYPRVADSEHHVFTWSHANMPARVSAV